ncbi:hypothetical protein I3271_05225 [Photobacterium leiognathi]|uniref:hypothetical protein n=1 Tax=Photobacterium leiognathi TaxID=553611 RepID=UPI001EDFD093|nr:hypothetical protein [Photobacterium leiognathi]MCG3884082.1 hypothetical protein [Photobacterium leiognathi]
MLIDDGEFHFWVSANKQSLGALMDVADILIEDEFVNVKSLLNANKASDAMVEWVNGEKHAKGAF